MTKIVGGERFQDMNFEDVAELVGFRAEELTV